MMRFGPGETPAAAAQGACRASHLPARVAPRRHSCRLTNRKDRLTIGPCFFDPPCIALGKLTMRVARFKPGGTCGAHQRDLVAEKKFIQVHQMASTCKREHDGLSVAGAYGSELPPMDWRWEAARVFTRRWEIRRKSREMSGNMGPERKLRVLEA